MKTAHIVGGYRSAVGKSGKGVFRFTRPYEMGKQVVQHLLKDFPELDTNRIDDIIVGNATPLPDFPTADLYPPTIYAVFITYDY